MKEASMAVNCEHKPGDYTGQTAISSKSGKTQTHPQAVVIAKGGVSAAIPTVGDRLYSNVHVCNHARCASNDPNYNVKAVTAPKKFLIAKKHHYGGLDEKGGEKTKSSSTSSDHEQSHALHSLTNSVPQPKNDNKVRSNIPLSKGGRNNIPVPDKKKGAAERKIVRPTTSSSSATKSSGRNSGSSVVTESRSTTSHDNRRQPPIRKLKVGSTTDSVLSTPTEKGWQYEDSSSPKSSLTSISITQIISTSRGEEVGMEGGEGEGEEEREMEREVEQAAAAAVSSPTASVGSNHDDTEEATSILKETVMFLDCSETLETALEDSTSESSDDVPAESPAGETPSSSSHQKSSVTEATTTTTHDSSPSPSVPSGPGVTESSIPSSASSYSNPSITVASITPDGSSSVTTTSGSAGEILSLSLKTIPAGEEDVPTLELHTPSVASGHSTVSESPTSGITSDVSRPSPSSVSSTTTAGRSPLTTPPPSTNLKDSSNVRGMQPSSAAASAKKPTRVTKLSASPAPVDSASAFAPPAPTQLARRFVSDLQGSSAARKPASTKGVRSIELRGGKAQSYSKTTVTSWNMTTTTVENSPSISENSPARNAGSRISRRGSAPSAAIKRAWLAGAKENPVAIGPNSSTGIVELAKEGGGGPTGMKFARRARSMSVFNDVVAASEIVSLKHGEVAERRLSEEWMTNHALEDAVKKIADKDHRVKVLVHAFETLANLSDSEGLGSEDTALNTQLEYEVLSATPIAA